MTVSEWMTQSYDATAAQYRADDERHIASPAHKQLCGALQRACARFSRPANVLDLGCGTGRHFHCLRNVDRLIGVDISPGMIRQAQNPVGATQCQIRKVELICADFYRLDFPSSSFDLIFSFGVFGNGCHLSPALFSDMHQWLTPGGVLLLDTIDATSLPTPHRFRKWLRWSLHQRLPPRLQSLWLRSTGWPPCFYCSSRELWDLAKSAGFENLSIEPTSSFLSSGPSRKFLLSATKPQLKKSG
jgi:SAM-dependent methyltransferase